MASIDNTGYMVALSEGFTDIICKTKDGGFTDTLRIYVYGDYSPYIGNVYNGVLVVNDTQSINNFEVHIFTAVSAGYYRMIGFTLNGKYMSFGGEIVRENDVCRLVSSYVGKLPHDYGWTIDATFDSQGKLNAVIAIASQPPMNLLYNGSRVE